MDPATLGSVVRWLSLIERTLTTAGTIRAMLEEGLEPAQIDRIMDRIDARQERLRDMDLRSQPSPGTSG